MHLRYCITFCILKAPSISITTITDDQIATMFLHSDHSFDLSEWNDEQLWKLYLQGRQKALGGLFMRYYTRLFHYGMRLVGSEEVVKDAIQELFLKLWNNRKNVDEASSVEFYLLLSFRRILFRQKTRRETMQIREERYLEIFPRSLQSIEESIIAREAESERQQMFREALSTLSSRQKEVLYLRLHHGLTNKEIASILDLSLQRVKNYVYESTKQLREQIFSRNHREDIAGK
jgi:RNA polymerase sigma factor (sigma-70 family)